MNRLGAFPWKVALVVAVIVAEVLLLVGLAFSASGGPTDGIAVRANDALIEAVDQSDVTTQVVIARVLAPGDAWVVVQRDDGEGAPGAIMGAAHVNQGESLSFPMTIKSVGPLPIGAFITLVADLGQSRQLDYVPSQPAMSEGFGVARAGASQDKPFIGDGALVQIRIRLKALSNIVEQGKASIATATLDASRHSVVASGVVAPGPSWLEVSQVTTSGAPGPVLGSTPVSAGTHSSVTVPVGAIGKKQQLVAVLHVDLGVPDRFEFQPADPSASPDVPYFAGGRAIAVPVSGTP